MVKCFHKFHKKVLTVNNIASWVYKMFNVSRIVQKYIFLVGKIFSRMSRVFFFRKKKVQTYFEKVNHILKSF